MKARRRRQRLVVATMVVLGHLLLLVLFRQPKPASTAESSGFGPPSMQLALLDRAAKGADEPAIRTLQTADHPITPQPLQPSPLERPKRAVDVTPQALSLEGFLPADASPSAPSPSSQLIAAPTPEAAAGKPEAGGADCRLEERVQSALREDPRVRAALALVPSGSRSVANAVDLWNGAWIDAASLGGPAALDPLRAAIIETVLAASPACRGRPVLGPRFILVPGEGRVTILALGSGVWTWSDLLERGVQNSAGH